jgi:hypothetical protein
MSQSSTALGKARCAGSRTVEGATTGSQAPLFQLVRRPRWVSWIITAAPCPCTSSASSASHGTTSSRHISMLPNAWGLSRLTTAEPPIIVRPMPPLAFSA